MDRTPVNPRLGSIPAPRSATGCNALLGAMTLEEKVGQMDQQLVTQLTGTDGNTCGRKRFRPAPGGLHGEDPGRHKTGSILAGGTNNPIDTTGQGGVGNTGYDWANQYNIIQRYAIENSRLHIPVIFGVDAVHGFGHPWQAPLFPHSIGIGATWDPTVAKAGGAATGKAVQATGLELGIRTGSGPGQGQPVGPDATRPGPSNRYWHPRWAPPMSRACRSGLADNRSVRRRHRQTFRRILAVDQRARSK